MSTDYGVYCEDCKVASEDYFNRASKVQELIDHWPLLKRALVLIDEVERTMGGAIFTIDIDFYGSASYADDPPPAFMERHEGHNLKVCDEYGYLYSAEGVRGSTYERADAG